MKKILVLLFGLFAATQVFAVGTPCVAGVATVFVATYLANGFVVQDIATKCSANVNLSVDETTIGFAVAADSNKGKNIFTGNTGGGSVTSGNQCTLPCDAAQLTAPLAAALALAT